MNAACSNLGTQCTLPASRPSQRQSTIVSCPTLINICCPSYSGSTMLDLMLGNAGNCFSCGELGTWCRPTYRSQRQPRCLCGDSRCEFWQSLAGVAEQEMHDRCRRLTKSDVIIDSTKELAWIYDGIRWGLERDWNVSHVVLWKPPMDYAYSLWKRGKNLQTGLQRYLNYYHRFFELDVPWIGVNCEQLVADPEHALQALCAVLGIEYQPGREQFWEKRHHSLFGSTSVSQTLKASHPQLVPRGAYPPVFWRAYGELSRQVDMPRLRAIRSRLELQDVSRSPPGTSCRVGHAPTRTAWLKRRQLSSRLRGLFRWYR